MKKRLIALSLTLALCLSLSAPAFAAGPTFEDVPVTHWAYKEIERAYSDGAVGGTYHDPATGVRRYSPNDPLTLAQLTAILTRAFYGSEVNASTASGTWYAPNEAVARAHNLLEGVTGNMDNPVSRYNMAAMLSNVLKDKGADMPTASQRSEVTGKIADWSSIPIQYRAYVSDMYAMGILGGMDTAGTFSGTQTMNRAQMATAYGRVADAITGGTAPAPEQPTPTPTPEPTPTPGGVAAIGTISSTPVTLSLETHGVQHIPDYWSEQSAEIKGLTAGSEQAFNAYVHSLINYETIAYQGEFGTGLVGKTINQRYNYPVYKPDYTRLGIVENANRDMYYSIERVGPSSSNGLWFFTTGNMSQVNTLMPIFEPYLRQITPGMTDREKADLMMKCVTDAIDYKEGGGANWLNGKPTGDCESYGIMVAQLFSAAGLPNIRVTGTTNTGGGHMWNQVYLEDEGVWLAYDGPYAENGGGPLSFEAHANKYNYTNDKYNNTDQMKVCRALIETACRYAG